MPRPKTYRLADGTAAPRPFLKWAGGKQALAAALQKRFPDRFDRYFEPFLGGGSVFFALASGNPVRAVLADENPWLIDTYRGVRSAWRRVAATLDTLPNTKADYYRLRAEDPAGLPLHARAARLIYLNKTCFRGLFRVNRAGRFNVPYGAYDRRLYDPNDLAATARVLRGVDLRCADFESVLDDVTPKDFVYLDPPYVKLGGHADFNRYTKGQFREPDHDRFAALCRDLDRAHVRWLVSQSDTPLVRKLFRGFRIQRIDARREINLDATRRNVGEVVVQNY
ncbi:MAG: DNA adenine methylase [Planctomycetes bacterium]|nr:DNA adenine methylase [Planctomycetota bacterium]